MAETSNIEWCDGTVNFWWGCTKVGPGCDHCYAETFNNFRGNKQWGPGAPRRKITGAAALIAKLQRRAQAFIDEHGRKPRIFLQSMSDTFDNEVDDTWRTDLFDGAEFSDLLSIMLLTKRIGNVLKMIPYRWREGQWPQHVGLMITVVTQREADRDIPKLLELKALLNIPWIGVSIEPMLEPMYLRAIRYDKHLLLDATRGKFRSADNRKTPPLPEDLPGLDLVIVGGESGKGARPVHPAWVSNIRRECEATGSKAAFLFKQWGEWVPSSDMPADIVRRGTETIELDRNPDRFVVARMDTMKMFRVGKHRSGRTLDGREHINFPEAIL